MALKGQVTSPETKAKLRITSTRHGMSGTRTYRTWDNMIYRCTHPRSDNFRWYGGKGVTVCEQWFKFENFLADMGERPEGKTLDRVDGAKGYEPGNCRWATHAEQMANRGGRFNHGGH